MLLRAKELLVCSLRVIVRRCGLGYLQEVHMHLWRELQHGKTDSSPQTDEYRCDNDGKVSSEASNDVEKLLT
jgi:hypothetical protein